MWRTSYSIQILNIYSSTCIELRRYFAIAFPATTILERGREKGADQTAATRTRDVSHHDPSACLASSSRNATARSHPSLPDGLNPTPVTNALILRYQWDIHFERASDNEAVGRVAGEGAAQPRGSDSGGRGKRK